MIRTASYRLLETVTKLYALTFAGLTVVLMLAAIVLVPRGAFEIPGAAGPLLGSGVLLACAALLFVRGVRGSSLQHRVASFLSRVGLKSVWVVGVVLQICAALALHPVQTSDHGAYLSLAHHLVSEHVYRADGTHLAFWPPGLPLFLTPFVWLFANDFAVILSANLALYLAGCVALHTLTKALFGPRAAIIAAVLFTVWPTRLLIATLASKENLTLTLVTLGLMLVLQIRGRRLVRGDYGRATGIGLAMGFAALAQPGLLLLFVGFPLVCWPRWHRLGFHAVGLLVVAGIGVCAVVFPWVVRNYVAFDGQFLGVATNGGSVFYRANNELATGTFTPRGSIAIDQLPELEENKVGFELGRRWIAENPVAMLKLSAKKLAALLDSDSQGPYWAIQRGTGLNDADSIRTMSSTRRWALNVANALSSTFWILVCAAAAWASLRATRSRVPHAVALLPLVLPLVYCAAVFAIFESGARQHIFAVPALIAIAASVLRPVPCRSTATSPSLRHR